MIKVFRSKLMDLKSGNICYDEKPNIVILSFSNLGLIHNIINEKDTHGEDNLSNYKELCYNSNIVYNLKTKKFIKLYYKNLDRGLKLRLFKLLKQIIESYNYYSNFTLV